MLSELHITDFALVEQLTLMFGSGLNVLTGETGAGKSIIIDAIGAVLGERTGPEHVRSGADRSRIDATFEVEEASPSQNHGASTANTPGGAAPDDTSESAAPDLTPAGFAEDGLLLITRDIARGGRSGIRINGRPATLAMVRQVTASLVDMHGQHEHQSLLNPERHADILDAWAGREALDARVRVRQAFQRWTSLQRERARLMTDEKARNRRIDLLKYQVEEIAAAQLRRREEDHLLSERKRLAGAEKLFANTAEAMALLSENDSSAVEIMGVAVSRLQDAVAIDPELAPSLEAIQGALFTLDEAVRDLSAYRDSVEFNPERLAEVEDRLDLIRSLKRKYGDSVEEILTHKGAAARELAELEHVEERSQELDDAISAAQAELTARAATLTALRRAAAPPLETALMRELADLAMEKSHFRVEMEPCPPLATGAERIEFLLSANPGEPLKPLAKVASGGELSRIMLALKSVVAKAGGVPVMIFDEIDVGVGGRTGSALAAKLRALGEISQVLCVTHLPQIAAAAHRHFSIQKGESDGRTLVRVAEVTGEDRVVEVARMLGGGSDAAMTHARELLDQYRDTLVGAHV